MKQILKTFKKTIQHGQDMGYDKTVILTYNDIEGVARDYGKEREEVYFHVEPVGDDFEELVNNTKAKLLELSQKEEILERERKIENLKNEISEIELEMSKNR